MSWGFGAGYPLHPRLNLLKSLLWHRAGAEASREMDGTQEREAGTMMDQEEKEDGGSASCIEVSPPSTAPNSRAPD